MSAASFLVLFPLLLLLHQISSKCRPITFPNQPYLSESPTGEFSGKGASSCVVGTFPNNVTFPHPESHSVIQSTRGRYLCIDLIEAVNLFEQQECQDDSDCYNSETGFIGLNCVEKQCVRKRENGESCSWQQNESTNQDYSTSSCYSGWCMEGNGICASLLLGHKCKTHCNEGFCLKREPTDREGVCTPFIQEDEYCAMAPTEGCDEGLYCDTDASTPICTRRRAEEEPCKSNLQCEKSLYCKDQTCAKRIPIGDACDASSSNQECEDQDKGLSYCDPAQSKCVNFYSLGQTQGCSNSEQCLDHHFCIDGRCVRAPSCESDSDCGTGFQCYCNQEDDDGGTCSYQPENPRCGEYLLSLPDELDSCGSKRYSSSCYHKTASFGAARKFKCLEEGLQQAYPDERLGIFLGYNGSAQTFNLHTRILFGASIICILLLMMG